MVQKRRGNSGALTAILATIMLIAWSVILLGAGGVFVADFCAPAGLWGSQTLASLDLALAFNPPTTRAVGWALMLAALMPPLIAVPLRHIRDRSFASRRGRAMALFALAYVAVWMMAGVVLQFIPLVHFVWPGSFVPVAIGMAVALLWQLSPAKQYCLNRCHRVPNLTAFGVAADHHVLVFGLTHGAWCIGTCWALMMLPLLVERGHVLAMAATALFLFSERLERPAPLGWRWHGTTKALRIVIGQVRIRLNPRRA